MTQTYDYIIIGAGSAGCVLAHRLSADPAISVLLLEAGGQNRDFLVEMPKGVGKLVTSPQHSWNYPIRTVGPNGDVASETWQRGRGLGGSSAINGMIYIRGQPRDYDCWQSKAGPDWGWPEMKQAFRAIEDHELGDDGVRGAGGPVRVTTNKFRYPLSERAIEAGIAMGLPRHYEDLNREDQEGIGYYCYNIKNGRRQSAAVAFLNPVRGRKNLHIVTDVHVDRILFEERRAAGVQCRVAGRPTIYRSGMESIISAGTIASPKLLQLSGIGPESLLRRLGIDVVQHSPDVGRRVLEHLGIMMTFRLKGERGVNHRLRGLGLARSLARYLTTRTGPLANGAMEVGAFLRTDPAEPSPNAQLYVSGWTLELPKERDVVAPMQAVERIAGMTIAGHLVHLDSEASIEISAPDPDAPLTIRPNWLASGHDRQAMVDLVRWMRRYAEQPPLARYIAEELRPGRAVATDAAILDMASRDAMCGTHAVGSCRMGHDADSVVDERLRVRGVTGLRVVDCSVMPGLISGNTNAPAMAVGWRASDLILEDLRLRNTGAFPVGLTEAGGY